MPIDTPRDVRWGLVGDFADDFSGDLVGDLAIAPIWGESQKE
jgi:hypothetical protein